jgi:hypothetical protein
MRSLIRATAPGPIIVALCTADEIDDMFGYSGQGRELKSSSMQDNWRRYENNGLQCGDTHNRLPFPLYLFAPATIQLPLIPAKAGSPYRAGD